MFSRYLCPFLQVDWSDLTESGIVLLPSKSHRLHRVFSQDSPVQYWRSSDDDEQIIAHPLGGSDSDKATRRIESNGDFNGSVPR